MTFADLTLPSALVTGMGFTCPCTDQEKKVYSLFISTISWEVSLVMVIPRWSSRASDFLICIETALFQKLYCKRGLDMLFATNAQSYSTTDTYYTLTSLNAPNTAINVG